MLKVSKANREIPVPRAHNVTLAQRVLLARPEHKETPEHKA